MIAGFIGSLFTYRFYRLLKGYLHYRRLVAAGIPFPNGWCYLKDLVELNEVIKKEPTHFAWSALLKKKLGVEVLPPIVGSCFFGTPMKILTSCEPLQDLYINKT